MKQYPKYTDCGVEWIGEIPEHWQITKLKFIGSAIGGLTYSPNDVVESSDEGKLVLRSSNIQNGKLELIDNVYVNLDISNKLTLRKGDILICSRNGSKHLIGKNICIDEQMEGNTFGAFMMIFRSDYWRFLYQYFNSPIFTSQSGLFLTATINQLTSGTLNNFLIAIPKTLDEQNQIAKYLDFKTNQIEILIVHKQKLIELLQEECMAIINQAVTKGINPKAKLKPSDIEWLGDVPENWEVKKLKFVANLKSGENIVSEQITSLGEYPVYGGNGLRGYYTNYTNEGNYVLIGRQGALCGNINYANDKFWASEHAIVCYLFDNNNWFWLGELLRTMNLNQYSQASAQPGLAVEKIKNLSIPVPNEKEQNQIADFIKKEQRRIGTIIAKTEQEIELMKEYKTALISEVVTGKIDVRDEKIK